jgi:hypothetical protein
MRLRVLHGVLKLSFQCRLTDDWIPVWKVVLDKLGWKEGDRLSLEVVGEALLVTKVDQTEPERGHIESKRSQSRK